MGQATRGACGGVGGGTPGPTGGVGRRRLLRLSPKKRHCVTAITTPYLAIWAGPADSRGRAINSRLNDPAFWSSRADEIRTIAEQLQDHARTELMLRIAEDYDLLAKLTKSHSR